jgi:hypothetical protein
MGGAPPPGGLPPEGMPPELPPEALPPEGPPPGAAPQSEVEGYSQIIDSITSMMELPTVTEQERSQLLKAVAIFQGLLADNEKMEEQAGANPALRKALVSG